MLLSWPKRGRQSSSRLKPSVSDWIQQPPPITLRCHLRCRPNPHPKTNRAAQGRCSRVADSEGGSNDFVIATSFPPKRPSSPPKVVAPSTRCRTRPRRHRLRSCASPRIARADCSPPSRRFPGWSPVRRRRRSNRRRDVQCVGSCIQVYIYSRIFSRLPSNNFLLIDANDFITESHQRSLERCTRDSWALTGGKVT